ncbi:carbamoyltransferase HypF [Saccharicrinis sp. GN24d3]|uniref:carbamoyltransferase HypF n=1 Tax=Saccharicrinis sp. GN24d3 TaxID=3458416 RepID=UPI004036A267
MLFRRADIENKNFVRIHGLVQGVGFRPFVYKLAKNNHITGFVRNTRNGVEIGFQGNEDDKLHFIQSLATHSPAAADITSIDFYTTEQSFSNDFRIIESVESTHDFTEISPDIAICSECLHDMSTQSRRLHYSFTNCTHCGPRFTIIKGFPYDRKETTMDVFEMCHDCAKEYYDVDDRRFHAQPISCNNCGPGYTLLLKKDRILRIDEIIRAIYFIIKNGGVLAIKGVGSFFLVCDAMNQLAVDKVRKIKRRDKKPFAVMFSDEKEVEDFAFLNNEEKKAITSWQRPVVLLEQKRQLTPGINDGLHTLGCMLPYMPFHYLLFDKIQTKALVYTSCNISGEPNLTDNHEVVNKLENNTDGIVMYNRQIWNRADDSVLQITNGKPQLIRRSRGYVPRSIDVPFCTENIIATGAEQKNCFAIGKENKAILSQHIGDIKNYEIYHSYRETVDRFMNLYHISHPACIVTDAHPDYLTTKFANDFKTKYNTKCVKVYHHHAHIASVLAEHGLTDKVIGICFDGSGYGTDGNIWGSEFMCCDLSDFSREYHFEYIPMPGGDLAVKQPWRMAVAYLYHTFGEKFQYSGCDFLQGISMDHIKMVLSSLKKNINVPLSCSAGRLFDAIASMINICNYADFEAEAPMKLEARIDKTCQDKYGYEISGKIISFKKTIAQILKDLKSNVPVSIISARFHQTIIEVILKIVTLLQQKYGINHVILSGGTFQNRYLLEHLEHQLQNIGFKVYTNRKVPPNDGGIALGQIAIAANYLNK